MQGVRVQGRLLIAVTVAAAFACLTSALTVADGSSRGDSDGDRGHPGFEGPPLDGDYNGFVPGFEVDPDHDRVRFVVHLDRKDEEVRYFTAGNVNVFKHTELRRDEDGRWSFEGESTPGLVTWEVHAHWTHRDEVHGQVWKIFPLANERRRWRFTAKY